MPLTEKCPRCKKFFDPPEIVGSMDCPHCGLYVEIPMRW